MALSGSTNFSVTRDDIIRAALKKLGVYDANDGLSADDSADAAFALNSLVKEIMAEGQLGLWKRKLVTVFIESGKQKYSIGPSGDRAAVEPTVTTLSADAASAATTISVTSATGISDTFNIGIKLDSGSIDWTTVSGAPSGTTVTLSDALTGAASSGNNVYVYESLPSRPQRLLWGVRRTNDGTDTTMTMVRRDDYLFLPDKADTSTPTTYHYQPDLTNGTLYVWGAGNDFGDRMVFVGEFPVEDFDATTDNPDFPQEWYNALVWMLAAEMAPEYGLPIQDRQQIMLRAEQKKNLLLMYGQDNAPLSLGMETEGKH